MAFPFPVGYNPAQFYNQNQPFQGQQFQNQQFGMTPPTIHAEIVQVDSEQAAANYPVGAGASQMMIAKDDSAIYVKSALPNGQFNLDVFQKRPPAPAEPPFNPAEYVRRDEIDSLVSALIASQGKKKKEVNNEPV